MPKKSLQCDKYFKYQIHNDMGLTSKSFQGYCHLPNKGTFLCPYWIRVTSFGTLYHLRGKGFIFRQTTGVPCSTSFLELGPQIPSQHLATGNKDSSISQPPLQLSMVMWLRSVQWDISRNVLWQRPETCLEIQLVCVSSPRPPLFFFSTWTMGMMVGVGYSLEPVRKGPTLGMVAWWARRVLRFWWFHEAKQLLQPVIGCLERSLPSQCLLAMWLCPLPGKRWSLFPSLNLDWSCDLFWSVIGDRLRPWWLLRRGHQGPPSFHFVSSWNPELSPHVRKSLWPSTGWGSRQQHQLLGPRMLPHGTSQARQPSRCLRLLEGNPQGRPHSPTTQKKKK